MPNCNSIHLIFLSMQVKERTFSVSNMIFFTFNSQQYFKYFDFREEWTPPQGKAKSLCFSLKQIGWLLSLEYSVLQNHVVTKEHTWTHGVAFPISQCTMCLFFRILVYYYWVHDVPFLNTFGWQEMADLEGDTAAQYKISQELEELEERANELDRRRTNNISSIR